MAKFICNTALKLSSSLTIPAGQPFDCDPSEVKDVAGVTPFVEPTVVAVPKGDEKPIQKGK